MSSLLKRLRNGLADFLLGVIFFQKYARPLSLKERTLLAPYFAEKTLNIARICETHTPFWLYKSMGAVVLGCHVYFRPSVYVPHEASGIELLAHELTHVEQYLSGMTIVKYLWASRHGYYQNPYEIEAYAKGALVKQHQQGK